MQKFTLEDKKAFSKVAVELGVNCFYGKGIKKGDLFLLKNYCNEVVLLECNGTFMDGDIRCLSSNEGCCHEDSAVAITGY